MTTTADQIASALCKECRSIFQTIQSDEDRIPYLCHVFPYYSGDVIVAPDPNLRNCQLCSMLRHELLCKVSSAKELNESLDFIQPDPSPIPKSCEIFFKSNFFAQAPMTLTLEYNRRQLAALSLLEPFNVSSSILPSQKTLESSTDSSNSFELCLSWLKTCDMDHSGCSAISSRNQSGDVWNPTRLLAVMKIPSETNDCIRLIDQVPKSTPLQYAALSHCWGNNVPLVLLSSLLHEFKQGILVSDLPKTFRDAVIATRRLGLEFLWIDSLCIIQNSTRDWENESSMMSKIYSRCYVNLAATHSKDSAGGLFANRDPNAITPAKVVLEKLNFGPRVCFVLPSSQVLPDYLEENSVLARRAWVLQESILAPKTLHFGPEQITFECSKMIAAEGYPLGFEQTRATGERYETFKQRFYKFHLDEISGSQWDLKSFWWEIVRNYSNRRISKDSDVLVALSGIASQMSALAGSQDQYVAGLWRSDLPRTLMWTPLSPASETATYVAPSWSWASLRCKGIFLPLDSNVNYHDGTYTKLDVLDVKFTPTNIPFGPVSSASIRVTGSLAKGIAHYEETSEDQITFVLDQSGSRGYVSLCDETNREANTMPHGEIYYCLHVLSSDYASIQFMEGLLLVPTGMERGQYRRIGSWIQHRTYSLIVDASLLDPSMYEDVSENQVTISIF